MSEQGIEDTTSTGPRVHPLAGLVAVVAVVLLVLATSAVSDLLVR